MTAGWLIAAAGGGSSGFGGGSSGFGGGSDSVDRDGRTLPPERWTLALDGDGDGETPWRIVAVQ